MLLLFNPQTGAPVVVTPLPPVVHALLSRVATVAPRDNTGTADDMLRRMEAVLPKRWLPTDHPIVVGTLSGLAAVFSFAYDLIQFAKLQTRVLTASGYFLDLIALDFFGRRIQRRLVQTDDEFRATITKEFFRERVTRKGLSDALLDLTGFEPTIFEASNPSDTGGWNEGHLAFNTAGAWGSLAYPAQVFVDAYRPRGAGIPSITGYIDIAHPAGAIGGWNGGAIMYASIQDVRGGITDQDIYDAIESVRPAGVIDWTAIH